MKQLTVYLVLAVLFFSLGFLTNIYFKGDVGEITSVIPQIKEERSTDYSQYTIDNLKTNEYTPGKISQVETITDNEDYLSSVFKFSFKPDPNLNNIKTISGQVNIPKAQDNLNKKYPLILMLRGYIDKDTFVTGDGTRRAGEVFAENGYITVAPDFLGYGTSDSESGNIFETRFQTYTTVLSLIKSLDQIAEWDKKNLFIWAHSNGGHVALTILEITGAEIPTSLWAPVSKPFPYSVLYYTDQSVDNGKLIRTELNKFEKSNDPEKYSLTNYFDKINAPLQIQQGDADDAVPITWSNTLVQKLEDLDINVTYYTYNGTDHNMRPTWDLVVDRDLIFFKKYLK